MSRPINTSILTKKQYPPAEFSKNFFSTDKEYFSRKCSGTENLLDYQEKSLFTPSNKFETIKESLEGIKVSREFALHNDLHQGSNLTNFLSLFRNKQFKRKERKINSICLINEAKRGSISKRRGSQDPKQVNELKNVFECFRGMNTQHFSGKKLQNSAGKNLIKEISSAMNIEKEILGCQKQNIYYIEKSRNSSKSHSKINESLEKQDHKLNFSQKDISFMPNHHTSTPIFSLKYDDTSRKNNSFQVLKGINFEEEGDPSIKSEEDERISSKIIQKQLESNTVIRFDSTFKFYWDLIIFTMVFYTILVSPVYLCFFQDLWMLKVIEIVLEFFFIIEFLLNFFTSFLDHEENHTLNLNEIIENYILSWFILDFVSLCPLEFIDFFLVNPCFPSFNKIKFNSNFDFYKWFKMLRLTKLFRTNSSGRFIKKTTLNENYMLNRVLKFAFMFFIMSHIASSFYIFLGQTFLTTENWITKYNFSFNDKFEMYIASFYYILVTIYTIGYGDIVPVNIYEKLCMILFMLIGSMLYSYAVSTLSTMFSQNNTSYTEYRKRLDTLKSINNEYNIPVNLFNKLKQTLKNHYKKNENERYEFLNILPTNLKNDLMMIIYNSIITEHKFFKNQPIDFILSVLTLLKHHTFSKGEVLFSAGDVVNEMYFVINGTLSVNMSHHYNGLEIFSITKHNHYGDIFLQMNEISPYELKCKSKSAEIFVLKKEDFLKIKAKYNQNIFDILEKSLEDFKKIDAKTKIYISLLNETNCSEMVKRKFKKLESFFLENGFNEYFFNNKELIDIYDYLIENDVPVIKTLLSNMENKKRRFTLTKEIESREERSKISKKISNGRLQNETARKKTKEMSEEMTRMVSPKKKKDSNVNVNVRKSSFAYFPSSNIISENNPNSEKTVIKKSGTNQEFMNKMNKKMRKSYMKIKTELDLNVIKNDSQKFNYREIRFNNIMNNFINKRTTNTAKNFQNVNLQKSSSICEVKPSYQEMKFLTKTFNKDQSRRKKHRAFGHLLFEHVINLSILAKDNRLVENSNHVSFGLIDKNISNDMSKKGKIKRKRRLSNENFLNGLRENLTFRKNSQIKRNFFDDIIKENKVDQKYEIQSYLYMNPEEKLFRRLSLIFSFLKEKV
jgi:hypothetical protein